MGLSNFPCPAEGVVPILVMNTVLSVALLKNMFRSMFQVLGDTLTTHYPSYNNMMEEDDESLNWRKRRMSISKYKSLCHNKSMVECCVCLSGFEANQEVSELPCKHFFHRSCLDKWFENKHTTCPLCRSID